MRAHRADVVHAHNIDPLFGARALAAARRAGARVVMHLHNYRLVCAIAIDYRDGERVHEVPGPQHAPRRAASLSRHLPEAAAYGAGLACQQRRTIARRPIGSSRPARSRPAASPTRCSAPRLSRSCTTSSATAEFAGAPPAGRGIAALFAGPAGRGEGSRHGDPRVRGSGRAARDRRVGPGRPAARASRARAEAPVTSSAASRPSDAGGARRAAFALPRRAGTSPARTR